MKYFFSVEDGTVGTQQGGVDKVAPNRTGVEDLIKAPSKFFEPISAIITNEEKGNYQLELTVDSETAKTIPLNSYILIEREDYKNRAGTLIDRDIPVRFFRVYSIYHEINTTKIIAYHPVYDLNKIPMLRDDEENYPMNIYWSIFIQARKNPNSYPYNSLLTWISLERSIVESEERIYFKFDNQKSLLQNIMNFCDTAGLVLEYSLWGLNIKKPFEYETGAYIISRVNLEDIEYSIDFNNVVKRLYPIGQDDITIDPVDADIYIDFGKEEVKKFNQYLTKEMYEDETHYTDAVKERLREQAKLYLLQNSVPKVSYKVKGEVEPDFLRHGIGTIITILDEFHNLDLKASIKSYTHDLISDRYTDFVLGNYRTSINGLYPSLVRMINNVHDESTQMIQQSSSNTAWQVRKEVSDTMYSSNNYKILYEGDGTRIIGAGIPLSELSTSIICICYKPRASNVAWKWTTIPISLATGTFHLEYSCSNESDGAFSCYSDIYFDGLTLRSTGGGYIRYNSRDFTTNWYNMQIKYVIGLVSQHPKVEKEEASNG